MTWEFSENEDWKTQDKLHIFTLSMIEEVDSYKEMWLDRKGYDLITNWRELREDYLFRVFSASLLSIPSLGNGQDPSDWLPGE
jgi:hypothetical protein